MLPRLSDYGSVLVLILLCAYYSFVTYAEQHPQTPRAAAKLAEAIVEKHGAGVKGLTVIGETAQDLEFANSFEARFKMLGGQSIGRLVVTKPSDLRQELQRIGSTQQQIQVIATHHRAAQWGPLQSQQLQAIQTEYESLRGIEVAIPKSYHWPSFLTRANLTNVVKNNADVAIIAIGMTMVIIMAGIDLSVGSLLALSAVVTAVSIQGWFGGKEAGLASVITSVMLAVLVTTSIGLLTGTLVVAFRIPAFIVTLAMMEIARGGALITSVQYQRAISGGATEGTPEAIRIDAAGFGWLGNGEVWGLPNPIWLMLILYVLAHILMTRTSIGRYIYAVGGNREAARLSGVPITGIYLLVYALCGAFAGLAGVMDASRFEGGRPNAGEMYELRVIAAVVVGGTSLTGGEGKIFWTLVGAMIIAVINNGLNMAGVSPFEQRVVFGLLILGAALLDTVKRHFFR